MTVCFFGNYLLDYPRIVVLKKGLRQNGVNVMECHTRKTGLNKYIDLYFQHKKIKNDYDFLLVGMAGYTLVWLAKLISSKPVIFDAFVSLYVTEVEDRKLASRRSLRARYLSFLERYGCKLADKVILDTNAHINYFIDRYKLSREKFVRVFVGADDTIFYPKPKSHKPNARFIVHWHGHIVPFHGIETVIEAAKLLQNHNDIEFQIVTRFNSKSEKLRKQAKDLKNVIFYPETDHSGLAEYINGSDICLGVFGDNLKARLVIPNKIYEAVACGKPIITADHDVISELFVSKQNIVLVEPNSAKELAKELIDLKNDIILRQNLGKEVSNLFNSNLLPKQLGSQLKALMIKLV